MVYAVAVCAADAMLVLDSEVPHLRMLMLCSPAPAPAAMAMWDTAKLLIARGADLEATNVYGETPW